MGLLRQELVALELVAFELVIIQNYLKYFLEQ
jgi:hypothetical protein